MTSTRLIRLPAVVERTGKSRSRIYEDIAQGTFPKPVKIGDRAVGWIETEISSWVEARIAARDAERQPPQLSTEAPR